MKNIHINLWTVARRGRRSNYNEFTCNCILLKNETVSISQIKPRWNISQTSHSSFGSSKKKLWMRIKFNNRPASPFHLSFSNIWVYNFDYRGESITRTIRKVMGIHLTQRVKASASVEEKGSFKISKESESEIFKGWSFVIEGGFLIAED